MISSTNLTRIGLLFDICGVFLISTDLLKPEINRYIENGIQEFYNDYFVNNTDTLFEKFLGFGMVAILEACTRVGKNKYPLNGNHKNTESTKNHELSVFSTFIVYLVLAMCLAVGILIYFLLFIVSFVLSIGGYVFSKAIDVKIKVGFKNSIPTIGLSMLVVGFVAQYLATYLRI